MSLAALAQSNFNYDVYLNPVQIPGLPGLHSYAFGQDQGKWLIIGGRLDGLHARQPFNSFPANQNNDSIFVIDIANRQHWSASLDSLPVGIKEQLQSTNMSFFQDEDSLYIIGGYAYSTTAANHITFPNLTSIQVAGLINAIVNSNPISPYFKQITDNRFALSGAYLGKIADTFYLVGGHRFDGRYNPMGNPTYTQTYSNQIRKFQIDNQGTNLSIVNYSTITDAVHLHRRDYNLVPQIFPDGTEGYTISSGVFQTNVDLPYLYPVDITANGYSPITGFNQYLSNYHSANAALYDSLNNEMHMIFFGGISQYYNQNGVRVQDNQVPFVKTISRLSRYADSSLHEFELNTQMPEFQGASAEFIPNYQLSSYESEIIKLDQFIADTVLIGHIYGGISSPTTNPFANNLTTTTSASPTIYEVYLVKNTASSIKELDGDHPFDFQLFPNPNNGQFSIEIELDKNRKLHYLLVNENGQISQEGDWQGRSGKNRFEVKVRSNTNQSMIFNLVIDDRYFVSKTMILEVH
jgi:hypothetical protein